MDPAVEQQMKGLVRKHKSALTRAKNSGDPAKVHQAATTALDEMSAVGPLPDNWHLWESARKDAEHKLRFNTNFNDRRGERRTYADGGDDGPRSAISHQSREER